MTETPNHHDSDSASEKNSDQIKTSGGIRLRAILIGVLLAAAICSITPFNNIYRQSTLLGGGHFPLAPFFIITWMTVLVVLFRKIFKGKNWLTGRELLVVWVLMVLVSGIAYTGLIRTFFINLTAPYHFATVENRWSEVLHPLLPEQLYPQSKDAIGDLYDGLAEGRRMGWLEIISQIPWDAWIRPLIAWSSFIALCYFVMICMISLFSRQWIMNERMNFPLLQVPLLIEEVVDNHQDHFFINRFFIIGLLIPICFHLLNGLSFYYPGVPKIPNVILAAPYFAKDGLFSGFHKLKIYFYPAFIGFAFLASKQISFSFWIFYIVGTLFLGILGFLGYSIPSAELGITFGPTLARVEETQMIGAYGVFFIFLLWLARNHLLEVIRQAFGLKKASPSEAEWLSARVAFWGFLLGYIAIMGWLHYFGMPFSVAFLVVGASFMVLLVATRIICQGGIAYFTLTAAPIDGLLSFFGPRFFTHIGIVLAGVAQKVLFVDLRESLMPSLLHAEKVTNKIRGRSVIITTITVTLIVGVVVSFLAMLALCYKFGLRDLGLDWATSSTVAVYENINSLVESGARPGHWVMIFTAMGAVIMLILVVCYHRFYWWPIHPIGYLTAYSSAMRILWFSFFIGWLCNALCMRYGGVLLFRRLRFFFLGLIVGDFLMGGSWAVIGLFSDASYNVLPS